MDPLQSRGSQHTGVAPSSTHAPRRSHTTALPRRDGAPGHYRVPVPCQGTGCRLPPPSPGSRWGCRLYLELRTNKHQRYLKGLGTINLRTASGCARSPPRQPPPRPQLRPCVASSLNLAPSAAGSWDRPPQPSAVHPPSAPPPGEHPRGRCCSYCKIICGQRRSRGARCSHCFYFPFAQLART